MTRNSIYNRSKVLVAKTKRECREICVNIFVATSHSWRRRTGTYLKMKIRIIG